jgi:NifU-like protein involved in Fe-S cluster formation
MEPRTLTGHAGNPPGQGPFITLRLVVEGDVIRSATYETYPCPGCQACGRAIVALSKGKTLSEARALKHEDVVRAVGPLPKHRQICYGLAILALADAL